MNYIIHSFLVLVNNHISIAFFLYYLNFIVTPAMRYSPYFRSFENQQITKINNIRIHIPLQNFITSPLKPLFLWYILIILTGFLANNPSIIEIVNFHLMFTLNKAQSCQGLSFTYYFTMITGISERFATL